MSCQAPTAESFWWTFCQGWLEIDQRLGQELWESLKPDLTLRYHLELCTEHPTEEAVMHFGRLLPPKALLAATVAMSPEGSPRRQEVIMLERAILARTDREGLWS